jgi:hypothetical protein
MWRGSGELKSASVAKPNPQQQSLPVAVRDYREVLNLTWTGTLTDFFATKSTLTHSFATEGNFVTRSSASAARR